VDLAWSVIILSGCGVALPDSGKVRELLTRRYGYAVDDVRHVDPLDALDDDGQLIPFVTEQKE
jgi:hypothetical protein